MLIVVTYKIPTLFPNTRYFTDNSWKRFIPAQTYLVLKYSFSLVINLVRKKSFSLYSSFKLSYSCLPKVKKDYKLYMF